MKFCFIILHYKNINETTQCVSSIQNCYKEYFVVIVDNASNDGSGEKLKQIYAQEADVIIIIQNEARGFSYGNNLGVAYALKYVNPDFFIICNNDIQFIDPKMYQKISQIYDETNFSVLGPDIYYKRMAEHQSPFRSNWMCVKETQEEIEYYQKKLSKRIKYKPLFNVLYRIERVARANTIIDNILFKCEYIYKRPVIWMQHVNMKCRKRQNNVCLYGACLIISRTFFSVYEKVFWPETYFYAEEDILLAKCIKKGLLVIYDPTIQVTHTNKASTFLNGADRFDKTIWRLEKLIESREKYIGVLQELELEKLIRR